MNELRERKRFNYSILFDGIFENFGPSKVGKQSIEGTIPTKGRRNKYCRKKCRDLIRWKGLAIYLKYIR